MSVTLLEAARSSAFSFKIFCGEMDRASDGSQNFRPLPPSFIRDWTGQNFFVLMRDGAADEKSSSQDLESIHMITHGHEIPTAFNSRRLHHILKALLY